MRRGFPRLVFIGPTIGLGLMFLADVAFAYELLGGKWANVNDLTWCWASSSYPTLGTDMAYAFSDWDATATELGFRSVSYSANITGYGYSTNDGLDGYADGEPSLFTGTIQSAEIYLNWYYLQDESGNYRRGTAGHEIGHTLGLAHTVVTLALMNTNRNRETVCYPQQDDVNGINYLYPRN